MSFPTDDVITAIASASGPANQGIVRVSGPATLSVLAACFPDDAETLATVSSPQCIQGRLHLHPEVAPLPCQLYFWPDQRSYTRQPSAEIHLAGSPPLLDTTLEILCQQGARLAQPGEFTMRAFLAGRLDLTQVEAVLGVIDATSQRDLDIALTQLAGGLATPLHTLREQLLTLLAHLEAGLDFVEEDIEFISSSELAQQLGEISHVMATTLEQIRDRGEHNSQIRIVLRGAPNVGKSSLLNALAGDSAALVGAEQGTTRDYVTRRCKINTLDCLLIDTAGTTSATGHDPVAQQAQQVSREQSEQATLELLCIDGTRLPNAWEQQQLTLSDLSDRIQVITKADLASPEPAIAKGIHTSSVTGEGLEQLRKTIYQRLTHATDHTTAVVPDTLLRCRESLRLAGESIERARELTQLGQGDELVAAELRVALDELATVVGAVYTDDLLDRIFSRFCIGK